MIGTILILIGVFSMLTVSRTGSMRVVIAQITSCQFRPSSRARSASVQFSGSAKRASVGAIGSSGPDAHPHEAGSAHAAAPQAEGGHLMDAGSMIATMSGLGFMSQIDPTQGTQGAMVSSFFSMIGARAASSRSGGSMAT